MRTFSYFFVIRIYAPFCRRHAAAATAAVRRSQQFRGGRSPRCPRARRLHLGGGKGAVCGADGR